MFMFPAFIIKAIQLKTMDDINFFANLLPLLIFVYFVKQTSAWSLVKIIVLCILTDTMCNMQVNFSFYVRHACKTLNIMDVFLFNTH